MPLDPGTKLGPYEIVAPLGAGGMGEVYRGRDTRLGRDVAIKVLPEHLSTNPEIRTRFEREAKTVSSLNHPNICTLFDVGREGEIDFLVLELIEGDTLAARLASGALSANDILRIGTQIADALDRAHRAGVIHRDLKPGNVMLTKAGAKLMDFGLARATGLAGPGAPGSSAAGVSATMTHSPTVGKPLTAEGTLLGTFQYMSPEQLEGNEADARSDIWALGCVLYEMATGRRAFEGRSQASLIAAILEREPAPIPEVPSGSASAAFVGAVPQGLDRLIRNCLAKDPDERIQTAHDIKLQLRGIAEMAGLSGTSSVYGSQTPPLGAPGAALPASGAYPGAAAAPRRGLGAVIPWAVAALAIAVGAAATLYLYPRATAPQPAYRFRPDVDVPGSLQSYWPRISPDGRTMVFITEDSLRETSAWIRGMNELTPRPIPGFKDANRVYWSPDSKEIAYVANDKILRLPSTGGTPTVVCQATGGADLSWGSKGIILMDGQRTDSLRYVSAAGGELRPATRLDRSAGEVGNAWPCFLPDGEHFLYIAYTTPGAEQGRILLGKIGSLESKFLGTSSGRVEYAPGGWILFPRGTTLLAQKLDLGKGRLTGQPITIAEDLRMGTSRGHFSISSTGILAIARGAINEDRTLQLADRSGALQGAALTSGTLCNQEFSPDGQRLLVEKRSSRSAISGDISVLDLTRGTETKLTFTDGHATTPEWSPDGRRFAWTLIPDSASATLRTSASDGLGVQDSIRVPARPQLFVSQWASSGSRIVLGSGTGEVFEAPTAGADSARQRTLAATAFAAHPKISPDGRWLAFATGRYPNIQVYVQSIVGAPGRWQISTTGGFNPRWTRGGREIVFESTDNRVMAVDIDTKDGFRAGTPKPLFGLPTGSYQVYAQSWACDESGQKFALVVAPNAPDRSDIEIVTDFAGLVNRK